MAKYIPLEPLLAEIDRLMTPECGYSMNKLLGYIDTLEVKEVDEKPNPRFPHLKDIVDKVFGAGNLESWEYSDAEMLVSLAKEELLKDIEVKEVDEQNERMTECPYRQVVCTMYEGKILECNGACSWVVDYPKLKELKAQKGE